MATGTRTPGITQSLRPDRAYDVIVLGAGAAGLTAAALAGASGLDVLLVEKSSQVGGTAAISGGMVWVPANRKMAAAGLADSPAAARRYLDATVPDLQDGDLALRFLDQADQAIAAIEDVTALRLRPVKAYPDYYPDLPGATLGGRVLEPEPYDAGRLGDAFRLLRAPLPEFMLFGGMMVDRADIPHFRRILRSPRSAARAARLVLRYARERLIAHRGTTLVLGNALAGRLFETVLATGVDLSLDTEVDHLVVAEGAVRGVVVRDAAGQHRVTARRGVILATGGFSHSAPMRARHLPAAAGALSAVCPTNTGDGIALGLTAGARMGKDNANNAFWTPVSRFRRADGSDAVFPHTVTDRGKPGLIAVDGSGHRFANEAVSYHEFVQAMFRAHNLGPAIPCHLICDRHFLWRYGLGAIKPFTPTPSLRQAKRTGYLRQADSIEELARRIEVDPSALTETVEGYNREARQGRDPAFGRGGNAYQRHLGDAAQQPNPCVAPIETPPYFSVALYPGDLGTALGLETDDSARVLGPDGHAVGRLYACGNDMNSVMKGAYPGPGITLGPALTFGYLAVQALLADGRSD
ncbi:MAG TPA: FAD-dependent oxidoreductase [Stellaceae bacterium]|nr:FAD-dependent oxidoreductase [Stellaceae bacterium]